MRVVFYERDEAGLLTRIHRPVQLRDRSRKADYKWREVLTGWPERVVYWTHETGIAVGVAPVDDPARA